VSDGGVAGNRRTTSNTTLAALEALRPLGHGAGVTKEPTSGREPPREATQADRAQLATRLLAALYERYWTQGDLAWEAGLPMHRVALFCHGTEWPDPDSLARLAAALGLPLGGLDPVPEPEGGPSKGRPRKSGKILKFSKRRR
jgi:hypothetical protein